MRVLLMVPALLYVAVSSAGASDIKHDGNWLYRACKERNSKREFFDAGLCIGFVIASSSTLGTFLPQSICLPKGVQIGQLTDVVFQFLEEHPKYRHEPAAALVSWSLQLNFPCPNKILNCDYAVFV